MTRTDKEFQALKIALDNAVLNNQYYFTIGNCFYFTTYAYMLVCNVSGIKTEVFEKRYKYMQREGKSISHYLNESQISKYNGKENIPSNV